MLKSRCSTDGSLEGFPHSPGNMFSLPCTNSFKTLIFLGVDLLLPLPALPITNGDSYKWFHTAYLEEENLRITIRSKGCGCHPDGTISCNEYIQKFFQA